MIPIRIVIQSRLNSSRLPAKALLPIAGIPSLKLCAQRAGNTELDLCIATSEEASDDVLTNMMQDCGFKVYRGPLDDVLKRFTLAIEDMPENGIVVRLTADNPFPDGSFIESLVEELLDKQLKYICSYSPLDGLPYGMSAEVFTVDVLRQADHFATSKFDREHVTPWIIRRYGRNILKNKKIMQDLSHLRCTMDTLDDYLQLLKVFEAVKDAISIPWWELCQHLLKLPDKPQYAIPYKLINGEMHSRFTLGTVQLGMPYGVANRNGMPTDEEAQKILETAVKYGINSFDTARAYGDSERRLGKILNPYKDRVNIITKLSPLADLREDMLERTIVSAVDASIFQSCRELNVYTLSTVLLHNPGHLHLFKGTVWRRLEELQKQGVIKNLGISVYNPEQLLNALKNYDIKHVQLSMNLLDWRWLHAEVHKELAKNAAIIVHARSVFLQGVLLGREAVWPAFMHRDASRWIDRLERVRCDLSRSGVHDLCVSYILGQDWIHSAVIGVETLAQLDQNMRLFLNPPLTEAECRYVEKELSGAPETLLNPALW